MELGLHFAKPTSIFIGGNDRPLLNWCALALARKIDPDYFWTDVRLGGEALDPADPLARSLIPSGRFHTVEPPSMPRDERSAEIARKRAGELLRSDDPSDARARLIGFLGLPVHTQEILSGGPGGKAPKCVVLSNAHRLIALYPAGSVAPTVQAIVGYGATLITTFADAPPDGRWEFDTVLQVARAASGSWREATLSVERLNGGPRLTSPESTPVGQMRPFSDLLTQELPASHR